MASLLPNTSVLGNGNAKHLLRRATFKYTKTLINQFSTLTPQQALDLLLVDNSLTLALPFDPYGDGFWTESSAISSSFNGQQRKNIIVSGWWWYNAVNDATLKYKLSHFLSTRFTIEKGNTAGTSTDFYDYLRLLLYYSYGNYKTLAKKMTLCNSMLLYLNNNENISNSPNENYAREFLELFTIGKGEQIAPGNYTNYTETDIVQSAKVLTGFQRIADRTIIDTTTGIPKGSNQFGQHNTAVKTFSSAFNSVSINSATDAASMDTELDTYVEMIFNQMATAKNICRKMYVYFVKGNITADVETDIITPLAQDLYTNGYEIVPVLRRLLESKHFYDLDDSSAIDETIGAIIKSPLQQISEVCSYLQATIPDPTSDPINFYNTFYRNFVHDTFMTGANMPIFSPPNVAGHLAYYQNPEYDKSWISSATLIARYRLGESLLDGFNRISGNNNIAGKINISDVIKNGGLISDASDAYVLTSELCNSLFAQTPDADRINYFMNSFLLQGYAANYWTTAWNTFVSDNNNAIVEPRLKLMLTKILSAPESQIF
ncbi:DUF1800 family protein [Flavobacterium paronense]|uniref:DUF1800 family protein n=1 Tax=Flavobacterium paronense TaxID=1392775 RepID=A0ABV5GHE6_9FLAO|nr:DUF1800 family protein [Flavobacterium paronense]MDN3676467.1 DUF1800 family protein [Flavobacterium paronense]